MDPVESQAIFRFDRRSLVFTFLVLSLTSSSAWVHATSLLDSRDEYAIKAKNLHRVLIGVTWPTSNLNETSKTITLAVVGKDPFGKHLDTLAAKKRVGSRSIKVKRFKTVASLTKTQVLFVSSSLSADDREKAASYAEQNGILLVGERKDFIDKGGMLCLLVKKKKPVFEVNTIATRRAKIQISSSVLRLADRIIMKRK